MDRCTHEVRLQYWKDIIRCHSDQDTSGGISCLKMLQVSAVL